MIRPSKRKLGIRHFDMQIIGGAVHKDGSVRLKLERGNVGFDIGCVSQCLDKRKCSWVLVTEMDPYLLALRRLYGLLIDDEQYVEDASSENFNSDIDSKGLLWNLTTASPFIL
ncbi:hypothetical protein Tco_1531015 [Tanacetum coccineum]